MNTNQAVRALFNACLLPSIWLAAFIFNSHAAEAQLHDAHTGKSNPDKKTSTANSTDKGKNFPSWKNILTTPLSDSGLVNKEVKFIQIQLAPGYRDTVSHRHHCELFLYVQEGTLEYREGNKPSKFFKQGEVLREVPYSLHTVHANPSKTEPTKLLLVFLYSKGKPLYVREHPEKPKAAGQ